MALKITAILFAIFALLQYNDPDPVGWMALYGSIGVAAWLTSLGKRVKYLILPILFVAVSWAALLLPPFMDWVNSGCPSIVSSMKAEAPHIEWTREFLGLLLSAVVAGWLLWKQPSYK